MKINVMVTAGTVVTAGVLVAGTAQAAAPGWHRVKTPALPGDTSLQSVAALSKKDAWAVGSRPGGGGSVFLHWNGKSWSAPKSAAGVIGRIVGYNGGARSLTVAGSSPSDVWVAGNRPAETQRPKPVAAHWDGKKWRLVDLPNAGGGVVVQGLTVISKKDAWVSGTFAQGDAYKTYMAHWNGKKWSASAVPAAGQLLAVAAAGPRDVWAVGNRDHRPLIVHWNGTKWSVAKVPNVKGRLEAVAVLPKRKLWAAGTDSETGATILRSDGGAWRSAPLPAQAPRTVLTSLAGDGAGSVWLGMLAPNGQPRTWYGHWNEKRKRWDIAKGSSYDAAQPPWTVGLALIPGTRQAWSVNNARTPSTELYS